MRVTSIIFAPAFFLAFVLAFFLAGCSTIETTDASIEAAAKTVDYGNSTSATLVSKAWKALESKNYPELFAYTRRCVDLYADQARQMNEKLTAFEPPETASQQWALNDVGTCQFILANAYAELGKHKEAQEAYTVLARDYTYSQCWDPQGWFWHPAEGAEQKAEAMRYWQ